MMGLWIEVVSVRPFQVRRNGNIFFEGREVVSGMNGCAIIASSPAYVTKSILVLCAIFVVSF